MAGPEIDPYLVAHDEVLPARGATAFTMYAGQVCRVIDLEGRQVPDFLCFDRYQHDDKLSVQNTQLINGTIYITTGHHLISTRCRELMTIVEDTVGVHDLISGSCSEYTNAYRYGVRGTVSCRGNFERVLEPHGLPLAEIPYSFNIFMNVPVATDGKTDIQEPTSKPGDYIDLRANTDLLIAISNCPQERNPCNGFNPTPIRVVVYEPEPRAKGGAGR
jgi:uncharacterized protein